MLAQIMGAHVCGFTQASEVLVHFDRCIPYGVGLYSPTVALEHKGNSRQVFGQW